MSNKYVHKGVVVCCARCGCYNITLHKIKDTYMCERCIAKINRKNKKIKRKIKNDK